MLSTKLFDFDLPEEFIARYPAATRDGSRMMVLDRKTGVAEIHPFPHILDYLSSGDTIICNNTKVYRGRMFARKNGDPAGAKFELLMLEPVSGDPALWNVLLKPGKRAPVEMKWKKTSFRALHSCSKTPSVTWMPLARRTPSPLPAT